MNLSHYIKQLQATTKRTEKESILQIIQTLALCGGKSEKWFLKAFRIAYDPFVTFGITGSQIKPKKFDPNNTNDYSQLEQVLQQLALRKLTGNSAKQTLEDIIEATFTKEEWEYVIKPLLNRDMRCGVTATTFNKIVNQEFQIKEFSCQLATSADKINPSELNGKHALEVKLDGVRALVFITEDDSTKQVSVTIKSRTGKEFSNFPHIEAGLINWFNDAKQVYPTFSTGIVLDGEIMGESFRELMTHARRKHDTKATDSVFNVFDIITIFEFTNSKCYGTQESRSKILKTVFDKIPVQPHIKLVPQLIIDNLNSAEGQSIMKEFADNAVDQGFEGIMIKKLNRHYDYKRSKNWLKWKPVQTYDLQVKEVIEGTGKYEGMMGSILFEGIDDNKFISVSVGSGFSDDQRKEFWECKSKLIGKTGEVIADCVTQEQGCDAIWSLRFPRFKTWRDDK